MEIEKIPVKKTILNYGLLLGIVTVTIGIVMYLTNNTLKPHWIFSVISILSLIIIISYGINTFKTNNNDYLTLTDALKIGIGIAIIGGLINVIWLLLLTTVIEPNHYQQLIELEKEKLMERNLSKAKIEQSISAMEKIISPFFTITISLIGNLFFGFIISLIGGLIMKKEQELY